MLVRAYEVATTAPKIRYFEDPIGLLLSGGLEVDLDARAGRVAPFE